jgi:MoxR-like ATPase
MTATQQIFTPEPQALMPLGQPQQDGISFPVTLAEKYQPARIADFIGLEQPKKLLTALAQKPRPCALLLIGPPGAGKTAMGMAFAEQVAGQGGTLHHVAAQRCDVAELNALNEKFAYYPPRGQWWVCLVDEADQMTEKAQLQLLSRLDGTAALKPKWGGRMERGTPPPVIWIFTSNGIGQDGTVPASSFAPRFLSRCLIVGFAAAADADLAA